MRCDDPGGVCAADQPHRAGSEQMREKEGDTRQKGEEWSGERQSKQSSALFLSFLPRTGCTTAPPNRIGLQPPRWRRQEWCSPTFNTVCAAHPRIPGTYAEQARRHTGTGWGARLSFLLKGGPPLVAEPKSIHAPRPRLSIFTQEASSLPKSSASYTM